MQVPGSRNSTMKNFAFLLAISSLQLIFNKRSATKYKPKREFNPRCSGNKWFKLPHSHCVVLDLMCKKKLLFWLIRTSESIDCLRKNLKKQAKWISWLQYKPINLTLRQLTVNGVVQYHKSEAPRSYLQNSLSRLSCMVPVFNLAIHSALHNNHLWTYW